MRSHKTGTYLERDKVWKCFSNFQWIYNSEHVYNSIYFKLIVHYASWQNSPACQVWPHSDFPLHPVGKLTLNRNPRNYFAEVEQLAFSPAHLVPGIEPRCNLIPQIEAKWILWKSKFSALTKCSRVASSLTTTLTATGWAPTTTRSPSTVPIEQKLGSQLSIETKTIIYH